jgi:hypothetical protein
MGLNELLEDVRAADADGPVCDYWTTSQHSLSVAFLAEVSLVKPIKTKVPPCSDHWCPVAEECLHRERFETGGPGRSGVKATLTGSGRTAFESSHALAEALGSHRMIHRIRMGLSDGPRSLFELNTSMLRDCWDELDHSGMLERSAFRRSDLRGCLELLEALGEVRWDRATGMVSSYAEYEGDSDLLKSSIPPDERRSG